MSTAAQTAVRRAALQQAAGTAGMWAINEADAIFGPEAPAVYICDMVYISGEEAEISPYYNPAVGDVTLPDSGVTVTFEGNPVTLISVDINSGTNVYIVMDIDLTTETGELIIYIPADIMKGYGVVNGGGAYIKIAVTPI